MQLLYLIIFTQSIEQMCYHLANRWFLWELLYCPILTSKHLQELIWITSRGKVRFTEVEHFSSRQIYTYLNPSWTTHCLPKNPIDFLFIFLCNVVWKQVLNLRFFPGQQTNTFSLTVTFNELLIPNKLIFVELLNVIRLHI